MYQLMYTSRTAEGVTLDDLIDIHISARKRNLKNGITGILLYDEPRVLQLLEGPEEKVKSTFERIKKDSRHQYIHVVYEESVKYREFNEWSVGFQPISQESSDLPEGYSSFMDKDVTYSDLKHSTSKAERFMTLFRNSSFKKTKEEEGEKD